MSKLQKSKTLSLGRLATLSSIKDNLRVRTTFQKSELPPQSPGILIRRDTSDPNGFGVYSHRNNGSGSASSTSNYEGSEDPDPESPPLLFSAIAIYKQDQKASRPDGCGSGAATAHVDDHNLALESEHVGQSYSSLSPREASYEELLNELRISSAPAGTGTSTGLQVNQGKLTAGPKLLVRTRLLNDHRSQQDPEEELVMSSVGVGGNLGEAQDLEPFVHSKMQQLHNRTDGTAELEAPVLHSSIIAKVNDIVTHDLEDAKIESFQVEGIRDHEDRIHSSTSVSSSRSSSGVAFRDDDLEKTMMAGGGPNISSWRNEDDKAGEEYWSVPPKVPGLVIDKRDLSTADKWVTRHPDLLRVKGYHPFIAEVPLTTLMHFGFLTPTALNFVHNHAPVPHAAWDNWSIEVTGLLVKTPRKFTMRDLLMFPSRRLPVTLMCSGNRGKELSISMHSNLKSGQQPQALNSDQSGIMAAAGHGSAHAGSSSSGIINWGPGAVSTSVWGGAKLRDVLLSCGVEIVVGEDERKKNTGRRRPSGGFGRAPNTDVHVHQYFVRLLGADKYGTSIPLEVVLDESRDVLLAYEQNMDLLIPDHGFPVRLIVPGYTAGRSVKWLQKIEISDQASDNCYHIHENRMLPSHIEDLRTAISEGLMNRPEFEIGEMNVNSVISSPAHNSNILSAGASNPMKEYSIRGYAYSGCGKKISRVEVSLDEGSRWRLCKVEYPEQPTKFGRYWCWCFWELQVNVEEISRSFAIVVRAWDAAMNTQPEFSSWNLLGVMNNCWYRVKIVHDSTTVEEGELSTLTFEHPTQPGKTPGGWLYEEVTRLQLGAHHELGRVTSIKFRHSESSSSLDIGNVNSPKTPRPWRI